MQGKVSQLQAQITAKFSEVQTSILEVKKILTSPQKFYASLVAGYYQETIENQMFTLQEADERKQREDNVFINGMPKDNVAVDITDNEFPLLGIEKPSSQKIKAGYSATRLDKKKKIQQDCFYQFWMRI